MPDEGQPGADQGANQDPAAALAALEQRLLASVSSTVDAKVQGYVAQIDVSKVLQGTVSSPLKIPFEEPAARTASGARGSNFADRRAPGYFDSLGPKRGVGAPGRREDRRPL